ncbi:MAG TPA: GNAT family N-acetyltransferase [Reyranella sp.]|jgi:ribosomal protein S18 acetylase RimI-like enzyme
MPLSISLEPDPRRKRQVLERLTDGLPEWFGQPAANRAYAEQAEKLAGYVASVDGVARGLLLLKTHSPVSAEIYWMGVDRTCHRSGVGRALVEAACVAARLDKALFIFVQTLHPRVAYEPYERTRHFYESMDFRYMLEAQGTNDASPLAIYMKCL